MMIGVETENNMLWRFLYDFRRALLQHRKVRHALFMQMLFPDDMPGADTDLVKLLVRLDLEHWLSAPPPPQVAASHTYHMLCAASAQMRDLATLAAEQSVRHQLSAAQFDSLLRALEKFDLMADRVASGVTTAMTDLDPLTGLLNRTAMDRDLARVLNHQAELRQHCCIAMIDLDLFREVNDAHGHGFGDIVLTTLADRLAGSLRPRDQIYRYVSDEFLIVLPDTTLVQALPVLQRLRERAGNEPVCDRDISRNVTVSVGLTAVSGTDPDIRNALDRADAALHNAKQAGRNCVVCDTLRPAPEAQPAAPAAPAAFAEDAPASAGESAPPDNIQHP